MKKTVKRAILSLFCIIFINNVDAQMVLKFSTSNHNGYPVSCFGGHDGQITVNVFSGGTAPYTYLWSNGATTNSITSLAASYYSVTVTDANAATATDGINLNSPSAITIALSSPVYGNMLNVSCYHCSNGSITSTINNGVSPYSYLWTDGPTTLNRSGLGKGTYQLKVTDANGCSLQEQISLTEPEREDWSMNGVAGSNPPSQFIGTTDNKDLVFKTNGIERMKIGSSGTISFKTTSSFDKLIVNRITTQDSVIYVGDSTLVVSTLQHQIYTDGVGTYQGIGICGQDGIARAGNSLPYGLNSIAIGNYVNTHGVNSITIGRGKPVFNNYCTPLDNYADNTLYIGFNSTVPTVVVSPASGASTSGNVGIGIGAAVPQAKLDVDGTIRLRQIHSGGGFSILKTDIDGNITSTADGSSANQVLLGDGTWGNLPSILSTSWLLDGNSGINATNFVGTTDAHDLVLKANNTEGLRIDQATGNTTLDKRLYIKGTDLDLGDPSNMSSEVTPNTNRNIALVHDANDILTLNYNGGYSGGVKVSGKLGINADPRASFQMGNQFVIHDGNNDKIIARNYFNDGSEKRLVNGYVSSITFDSQGKLLFRTSDNGNANDPISWTNAITILNNGNVGIGTLTPPTNKLLAVNGDAQFVSNTNETNSLQILGNGQVPFRRGISLDNDPSGKFNFYIHSWQDASFNFLTNDESNARIVNLLRIKKDGKVGIGISDNSNWDGDYKLYVTGGIRTEKIRVDLSDIAHGGWGDFVFEKNYKLLSLDNLKEFIEENGHLPNVPSAEEIQAEGIDLGNMQNILLQKIEELTLYILDLKKQNDTLAQDLKNLKSEKKK